MFYFFNFTILRIRIRKIEGYIFKRSKFERISKLSDNVLEIVRNIEKNRIRIELRFVVVILFRKIF